MHSSLSINRKKSSIDTLYLHKNDWNHKAYILKIFNEIEQNHLSSDGWFKLFIAVCCGYKLKEKTKKIYHLATKTFNVWNDYNPDQKLYKLIAKYLIEK